MSIDRTGTPLVDMRDICISFGGVHAVDHVSVDLYPGEVVGLSGPQWCRQVDADQDPVGGLRDGLG